MRFLIVGDIKATNLNRTELIELMTGDCIAAKEGPLVRPKALIASNGSVIARYHSDPRFRANIDQTDIIDPDRMPRVLASRVLCRRMPLIERVATTDLIHDAAAEEDEVCADILARKTDVLWVGSGSPHLEEFVISVRKKLHGVAWIRTCGRLFDHISGSVPRARNWMQSAGLEWLHRMMIEPRRLAWRYLTTNPVARLHPLTKTTNRIDTVTDSGRMLDA